LADFYSGNLKYTQGEFAHPRDQHQCPSGFVTPGQVLQATVISSPEATLGCNVGVPNYMPPSGWTWTLLSPNDAGVPPELLSGAYLTANGSCNGNSYIRVLVPWGHDPFAPSMPGREPNAIFSWAFNNSGSATNTCPASCIDDFVADIERLP
jgi:hypothetical protein